MTLGGRLAFPGVFHGRIPIPRPALQLREVIVDLGDRALDTMRRCATQEPVERLAGLVQAIGELEELSEDEARAQDIGDELPRHMPLQGDTAIQHLDIDTPSQQELDERIRLERFGHHPRVLQLLGKLQRDASVPFRCREVSPEQPGVPEVLLDTCLQSEIVSHLLRGSREDLHGPPPAFLRRNDLAKIEQHAGPIRPVGRKVHRLLEDVPRERRVSALEVS